MRVAALVPCHLDPPPREFLVRLREHVGHMLVVDDGLREEAALELGRRAEAIGGIEVLALGRNLGKGHAVSRGLEHLRASSAPPDAVLVLDADGQHPIASVPAFLAAAERSELLIGDRFGDLRSMPFHRRLANRFVSRLLARVTGMRVRDSQCGMRLLRGRALLDVSFPGGRYESETRHLKRCLMEGVDVGWVPIPAIYGGERSSFRPLRDGFRVLAAAGERAAAAGSSPALAALPTETS